MTTPFNNDANKLRFILANLDQASLFKQLVHDVKNRLVDFVLTGQIDEATFCKITAHLSSQSRSLLYEKYFIAKHHLITVSAQEGRGDFKYQDRYFEYKVTGFNVDQGIHLVQLRLWQPVDYVIQHVAATGFTTFLLNKADMRREVDTCGGSASHGTKTANLSNTRVEKSIHFKVNDQHWERWVKSYLVADFNQLLKRQS